LKPLKLPTFAPSIGQYPAPKNQITDIGKSNQIYNKDNGQTQTAKESFEESKSIALGSEYIRAIKAINFKELSLFKHQKEEHRK